jgi:hypothetical protein
MRRIYALIAIFSMMAALALLILPFTAQSRGGGCYAPKGPFQQLSGEFRYDYERFGAVGKNWELGCTSEMPHCAVEAHSLKPEDGCEDRPSVEFTVWFLGQMGSDNPKCLFEIMNGGQVVANEGATIHHLKVIAAPKMLESQEGLGASSLQAGTPWRIKFYCSSE